MRDVIPLLHNHNRNRNHNRNHKNSNNRSLSKRSVVPFLAILLSHTTTFAFSTAGSSSSTTVRGNGSGNRNTHVRIHDPTRMSLHMDTDDLAVQANSYASANGIQVEKKRDASASGSSAVTTTTTTTTVFEGAPMSLLPNAYPRAAFEQSKRAAPWFNELVDRVSRDSEFLESTLGGGVSSMDPYTAKILDLYRRVYVNDNDNDNDNDTNDEDSRNGAARSADRLGIHRSDYMLHQDNSEGNSNGNGNGNNEYQLKQVELNTIASSFGGLSCKIANLHRYLTSRYEPETRDFLRETVRKVAGDEAASEAEAALGVPYNPTLEELPLGFKAAYDRYVERFGGSTSKDKDKVDTKPVVLFVVQEGETNTVDQRLLEFALWENHGIPVVRRSLTRLDSELSVSDTGALLLGGGNDENQNQNEPEREIAVVYFRAGYAPTDYPDGDDGIEWRARLTLETSRATKCPCLGYHLAGTKKVQQELARPGVLERFFPDNEEAVEEMRACFAGLYSLGEDATDEDLAAVRAVLDGGQAGYVLKPQREGGGYNFYGDDLAAKLRQNVNVGASGGDGDGDESQSLSLSDELAEYILMQRLFPPQQKAILMRGGRVEGTGDSISELGAFGTLLCGPDGEVLHNKYAGFLLRTKFSNVDEGGVASGFATLSSPYLC